MPAICSQSRLSGNEQKSLDIYPFRRIPGRGEEEEEMALEAAVALLPSFSNIQRPQGFVNCCWRSPARCGPRLDSKAAGKTLSVSRRGMGAGVNKETLVFSSEPVNRAAKSGTQVTASSDPYAGVALYKPSSYDVIVTGASDFEML